MQNYNYWDKSTILLSQATAIEFDIRQFAEFWRKQSKKDLLSKFPQNIFVSGGIRTRDLSNWYLRPAP